jgi:hypothetical protein
MTDIEADQANREILDANQSDADPSTYYILREFSTLEELRQATSGRKVFVLRHQAAQAIFELWDIHGQRTGKHCAYVEREGPVDDPPDP